MVATSSDHFHLELHRPGHISLPLGLLAVKVSSVRKDSRGDGRFVVVDNVAKCLGRTVKLVGSGSRTHTVNVDGSLFQRRFTLELYNLRLLHGAAGNILRRAREVETPGCDSKVKAA